MTPDRAARPWRGLACALLWPALAGASASTPAATTASAAPGRPVSTAVAAAPAGTTGTVAVWLDLDVPALASLPRGDAAGRAALRQRIVQQQDAVMTGLAGLGATEVARVQQLRNAVAVRLPRAALAEARRIPGVHRLRVVRDRSTDTP